MRGLPSARSPRRGSGSGSGTGLPEVEAAVILDLVRVACGTGASILRALVAVGTAVGGDRGAALCRASARLAVGATWDEAWAGSGSALEPLHQALSRAWHDGAAPAEALRAAADLLRRSRHSQALEAANRLAVRLVLPLGACYLPAFVLVGLVPVLISMARGSLAG